MSSATMVAPGMSSCSIFTVPLCAEDKKPCTYMIFFPRISVGNCLL